MQKRLRRLTHALAALTPRESQYGPVAQRLEQGTHNPLVGGSNPSGPTIEYAFRSLSAQACDVIVTCQNWTRLWYRGQGSRVHHFPNIFHAPMLIDHGCLYVRVPRGAHL